MICRDSLQFQSCQSGSELLRYRHLHKLVLLGYHHVHLAGLAGDDVDAETFRAEEHLTSVRFIYSDSRSCAEDLRNDKNRTEPG